MSRPQSNRSKRLLRRFVFLAAGTIAGAIVGIVFVHVFVIMLAAVAVVIALAVGMIVTLRHMQVADDSEIDP